MSQTSFHRVKWVIKAGALKRHQIEAWTGMKSRDIHGIEIGNGCSTQWRLAFFTDENDPQSFRLMLQWQNREDISVQLFLSKGNQLVDLGSNHGWKTRKAYCAADLAKAPLVINIVAVIRKEPRPPSSLKSLCAEKLNRRINVENVLEMLEHAVLYGAKEMEEKCLAVILLSYHNLKHTKAWQNLRPFFMQKINDVMHAASNETVEAVLDEKNHREIMDDFLQECINRDRAEASNEEEN